ncbi:MAG: 3-ketosteroid 5-isomerase [Gammaproteobacteria bacterium]|nr:3-ketosteroid 5-isomerase [Gammaproteobacteria bacterium]
MPLSTQQMKQAMQDYIRAWATNDRQLLLSLFAPDASWEDPVGTPEFFGHEGIGKFWDFAHQEPSLTLTPRIEEIRAGGNEGILRFTMQVRIPERNEGLDLSIIDRMVFDELGRIKVAKAFWDETTVSVPHGWKPYAPDISNAYES